jgi:hypothetical protein
MTLLILYATVARLGADLVRTASVARASVVPDLSQLYHQGPPIWTGPLAFLFSNLSQSLEYVGMAAMVEILYRVWDNLRIQNLNSGETA